MNWRIPGSFVPLDVNYIRDGAIRKAGPMAELLFIRAIAYAKGSQTGGFVPDYDLEVVAVGMRGAKSCADSLVKVGLWVRQEGGWQIRSWERWNGADSAASAGGRLGNHVRWHVNTGRMDPNCDQCANRSDVGGRSGGDHSPIATPDSRIEESREEETSSSETAPRPDVEDLCDHLHKRVTDNGSKATITQAWRTAARLLLDRDGRSAEEAHALIDWCQDDNFWHSNILGMPKFRKQYDQLRLKAGAALRAGNPMYDVNKLPDPGVGWSTEQLDMVLGQDSWTVPEAPADMGDDDGYIWQQQEKRRHFAERVQAALRVVGRTA